MRIGRAAALTDTGRRRLDNEDAFVLEPPLFAVADGMGGAQAGEVASRLAVSTIEERGTGLRDEGALVELLGLANTRIHRALARRPGRERDGHDRDDRRRRRGGGHRHPGATSATPART